MSDQMVSGEVVIYVLLILIAVIGTACSLFLCWIIVDMKVWNDFNRLIFAMTAFDVLYFICFANPNVVIDYRDSEAGYDIGIAMYICSLVGGISSYIISSYISFSVVHLLLYIEVFDINKWRVFLIALIMVPNIVWVIVTIIGYQTGPNTTLLDVGYKLTSIFRLMCVAFNTISYFVTVLKVKDIHRTAAAQNRETNRQENAIITITERLKWYPVLQVISRSFPTFYAFAFPNNSDVDDAGYNTTDPYRYWMNILSVVCVVVSPIGFLIVYLRMKPTALSHVKIRFGFKVKEEDLHRNLLNNPHYNVMGYPNYQQNNHLYLPQASISISTPLQSTFSNTTTSSFSSLKSAEDSGEKFNWKLFDDEDLIKVISDEASIHSNNNSTQNSMKSYVTSES